MTSFKRPPGTTAGSHSAHEGDRPRSTCWWPRSRFKALGLTALSTVLLLAPCDLGAQAAGSSWRRQLDVQGSLFVGNNPQTVLTTRSRIAYVDSILESGVDLRFTYGETTRDGERQVHQRWWMAGLNLDAFPHDRWSPFMLGTFESSLERRLLQRWNGGLGARYKPLDTDRTDLSVSLALLAERRVQLDAQSERLEEGLSRYSVRFRVRHALNGRAAAQLETFFQPEVGDMSAYLYNTSATLEYRMTDVLGLRFSYRDSYDTGAELRGARSNYDGQLVLGLGVEF